MKKRILVHLLEMKSIIFGCAIFNLTLAWLRSPEWSFHDDIFWATWLLISSVMLLTNRVWGNLAAIFFGGFLANTFIFEFWMLSHRADVPLFSIQHLVYFFRNVNMGAMLYLALTIISLWRAAASTLSSKSNHSKLSDA